MKLMGPRIVVDDIKASLRFYEEVLGEKLRFDLGANQQFESGLCLQLKALEADAPLLHASGFDATNTSHKDCLLYYETEEYDRFLCRLKEHAIDYVHGEEEPTQYEWGQRRIRFYDPDGHTIEVGEYMGDVIRRFFAQGLTAEDIVTCTEFPMEFVEECLK